MSQHVEPGQAMNIEQSPDLSVFCRAVELATPAERAAYLEQACRNNPALRGRVDALLRAHDEAGRFLDSGLSASGTPTATAPPAEASGVMIGPYKLREVLGEGGMGTVYVAEQEKPIHRKVALKVIKPGMDSKDVIARFEAERQALALMDHPNIARVLDAGTTELGRPYFVMELVRGMSVTGYCDRASVNLRDRLELFVQVCRAVEHAHRKGVLHRDLKPSNVMITLHDGVPVPKVIDFGLAKAVNHRLTEHTVYTRHAQMVGTPLYMSPEQAELSGLDIDARTDVYSLGVLLYELLTGTTPFDKETFSKVGYDEMRRIIREDEPPRPSHRVNTLAAATLSTVSANRGLDPRRLTHALRGDLDWIVVKALEKDRNRRYESASAMAADVQRYLEDQPVEARPPSVGYRLRKFARRHRRPLSTTAILTVAVPLAAYAVFMLINGTEPQPVNQPTLRPDAGQQTSATAQSTAPTAGRYLPGLVPEPTFIPEIGRWQLITKNPRGQLRSAVRSPDEKRIAVGEANNVRIYDATNLRLVHVLVGHTEAVRSVAWHPDGTRLASSSEDGTVRLWTADGAPTHLLSGHQGTVYRVAWRPDGVQLASASADGTVRLWNADGTFLKALDERGRHVFGVDWSPDSKMLASVGGDLRPPAKEGDPVENVVRLWDPEADEEPKTEFGGTEKHSSLCVDWRPDGKELAVGYGIAFGWASKACPDAGVRIWKMDGTLSAEPARDGTIFSVAWDSEGRRVALGGHRAVEIWDAASQRVAPAHAELQISRGGGNVDSLSWNQDGSRLLVTHEVAVRESDGDKPPSLVVENIGSSFFLARWSPDGKTIASTPGNPQFWNAADGTPAAQPDRPANNAQGWWEQAKEDRRPDGGFGHPLGLGWRPPRGLAWNKDGWLAYTSGKGSVEIRDNLGKLIASVKGHHYLFNAVDWNPAGDWLVSGGGESVRMWKRDGTAGPVMTRQGHEVWPVVWNPDGQWIASGGNDGTVQLWKPDGTPGKTLRVGHAGLIEDIAWSPDSRRIVSAGFHDGTLRVWNIDNGKTEWIAIKFDNKDGMVSVSSSGQPVHGDHALLEMSRLYLLEKLDGSMELLTFSDFRKRYVKPFVAAYADRCNKAAAKAEWGVAEAAFTDSVSFQSDGNPTVRSEIVTIGNNLSEALKGKNEYERAEKAIRAAINVCQKIVVDFPDDPDRQNQLAGDYSQLREILFAASKLPEALTAATESLDAFRKLVEKVPDNQQYRTNLINAFHRRADTHDKLKHYDEAVIDITKAIDLLQTRVAESPDNADYQNELGVAFSELGNILFHAGKLPEALGAHTQNIDISRKIVEKVPGSDLYRRNLIIALSNRAATHSRLEYHDDAALDATKAIDLLQTRVAESPDNADYQTQLGDGYFEFSGFLRKAGKFREALAATTQAIDAFQKSVEKTPDSQPNRNRLSIGYLGRAHIHRALKHFDDALVDLARAVEVNPESYVAHIEQGLVYGDLGQIEKKAAAFADALQIRSWLEAKEWPPRYGLALLRLAAADQEGYRATCQALLAEFAETTDPQTAHFVAWTAALHLTGAADYETPLRLAARADEAAKDGQDPSDTLGAVLYRAGRCAEAVERLTDDNRRWENIPRDGDRSRAYTWYFLAMAHHALGHNEEAAMWCRKADEWTDRLLKDPRQILPWNRELTLELLRREARALIDPESRSEPADATRDKPNTDPPPPKSE